MFLYVLKEKGGISHKHDSFVFTDLAYSVVKIRPQANNQKTVVEILRSKLNFR